MSNICYSICLDKCPNIITMNFVSRNAHFSRLVFFFYLFPLMLGVVGCGETSHQEAQTKLEQNSENVQPSAQSTISEKLDNYYRDLSSGQIVAENYYAPSVERFFNSENISRDQIAQSLQNSIKQSPNRQLKLIPSSVKLNESNGNYIAEIAGLASKAGATDTFRNRIKFNQNFEIIAYESMPAPTQNRKVGARYAEKEVLINDLLMALKTGKLEAIKEGVHPDLGAYFIFKNGLFPVIEPIAKLSDIDNLLGQEMSWPQIQAQATAAAIPDFNCDDEFAQQGCFYQALTQSFNGLSETIEFANQAEKRVDANVLAQVQKIEQLVSYQVVDTKTGISLFLGETDGRWYVFVIDLALYDCSA